MVTNYCILIASDYFFTAGWRPPPKEVANYIFNVLFPKISDFCVGIHLPIHVLWHPTQPITWNGSAIWDQPAHLLSTTFILWSVTIQGRFLFHIISAEGIGASSGSRGRVNPLRAMEIHQKSWLLAHKIQCVSHRYYAMNHCIVTPPRRCWKSETSSIAILCRLSKRAWKLIGFLQYK